MKPEEIKKLSEKRKELLEFYSALDSDSFKAKSIKRKYNELVRIENKLEDINFRLQENDSSLKIIEKSIFNYTKKLIVLLKNSDNSRINRKETDVLTDVIETLKLDEEKFQVKKIFLLKEKNKIYEDNLQFLKELGIKIDRETVIEIKGKSPAKKQLTELTLISRDLTPLLEETDSDDENLDTALKNYNKLKEEENSEEVLEPAPEF